MILDLRVSQLSGVEVYGALTGKRPSLPFVLTSGFDVPELPTALNGRNRYEFLEKPYLPCGLLAAVRQVMTN